MWFVFPQIAGLGLSEMAQHYAIGSLAEARAYLAHPVLGPRLRECARVVADTEGRSADAIFGSVDAMKLRSSMTLFEAADTGTTAAGEAGRDVFRAVLDQYFGGVPDEATLARLLRVAASGAASAAWPGDDGPGGTSQGPRQAPAATSLPPLTAPLPWASPRGLVSVKVSNTTGAGNGLETVAAGVW
jgi:uncharacterized protein (DUF1810 family)